MKTRTLLLLLCLFGIITPARSQLFKGGLLLGLNASQVDGDSYSGYDKLGLMGGVYIYTPISKHMDIQLEMEYMGKGAKSIATENDPVEYKSQLNYVELPIIIRYNTAKKIGIEAGLGFGYLFNFSETLSDGEPTKKNPFKKYEVSFILGLNYKISDEFSAVARFSYSVIPIAPTFINPNTIYPQISSGMFNNVFSLGISYEFGNN